MQTDANAQSDAPNGTSQRDKTTKKRKKRKAPHLRKSSRKVVIDDFEMMRVLGKGCAGKVLLVRNKASNELYVLKAITKEVCASTSGIPAHTYGTSRFEAYGA